jgi:outer membrane murein-binding lipoprotein Lpp
MAETDATSTLLSGSIRKNATGEFAAFVDTLNSAIDVLRF